MLALDDERWALLAGGYRMPVDVRPLLSRLEAGDETVWAELWDELHHQGDVGEASYAAVPHLVRIHGDRCVADWNAYALVSTIELARTTASNPEIPSWLEVEYFNAIHELAKMGAREILSAIDDECARAILSVLALDKKLRICAEVVLKYSEDELRDMRLTGESS